MKLYFDNDGEYNYEFYLLESHIDQLLVKVCKQNGLHTVSFPIANNVIDWGYRNNDISIEAKDYISKAIKLKAFW